MILYSPLSLIPVSCSSLRIRSDVVTPAQTYWNGVDLRNGKKFLSLRNVAKKNEAHKNKKCNTIQFSMKLNSNNFLYYSRVPVVGTFAIYVKLFLVIKKRGGVHESHRVIKGISLVRPFLIPHLTSVLQIGKVIKNRVDGFIRIFTVQAETLALSKGKCFDAGRMELTAAIEFGEWPFRVTCTGNHLSIWTSPSSRASDRDISLRYLRTDNTF